MTQLKSLLYLSILLCVVGLYNVATAQNNYYVKEDFERYGWWLGGPGNWTTGWSKAPFVPPATDTGYTWGPNRARFFRYDQNDPTLFSAYGSRRSVYNSTTPSNYESTYVSGIHSVMTTYFTYKPTTNPVYFGFKYFVNVHWTLVNKSDSFYVAVKNKAAQDLPDNWKVIFTYGKPQAGDTISGVEKWFDFNTRIDGIMNSMFTSQTEVELRFGFFSRNTPPGAGPINATRAWGAWVDNITLYEDVKYDLFVSALQLRTIIDVEVTNPAYCESFKPIVYAGSKDPLSFPDTYQFAFSRWNPTTNAWVVLAQGERTQANAGDTIWNPMGGNNTVSFLSNETRFKLDLAPLYAGTGEKNSTNNSVTRIYQVSDVAYNFGVDVAYNSPMYPESAASKLTKTQPKLTGTSFWMEKDYDLASTGGKTQVALKVTRTNNFALPIYLSYDIDSAYNIVNATNSLVPVTAAKLAELKTQILPAPGYITGTQLNGFKFNATGDSAYFNVIPDISINTNVPYVLKLKFTAYYKNRFNGNPVCVAGNNYVYAIIPRDYQLIPEKDREIFKPSATLDRIVHKLNVWRFNKHNRKVKFEFYGNLYYPAGTAILPDYTVNRDGRENNPVPVTQPRPRISLSVDTVIFGKVINGNAPAGLNDYFAINMRGYDGNILADSIYYYKIMADADPNFSLVINPATATIQKPGSYVYTITINRVNHNGYIAFNAANVTAAPTGGNLVYTFGATSSGPWKSLDSTTGNVFYMKVDAGATTAANSYVLTVPGKSVAPVNLTRTATCTLIVSANWRAMFSVREWNTFNPVKDFYFGMHTNASVNLDPTSIWPNNNEALVTNVPAPPNFSWYFKFPNGSGFTANEYKPLTEDSTVTTTYIVELRGRYPFIIYYDPRQTDLKNKEIKVMDLNDNGGTYSATMAYNANKTSDTLPAILNWALADVWQLKITVRYKPTTLSGSPTNLTDDIQNPVDYKLLQNYPNPFNPSTVISYNLPKDEYVKLIVVNSVGEVVSTLVDGVQTAGAKSLVFNAKDLPSGIYFYKIQAGSFVQTKKMMLVK